MGTGARFHAHDLFRFKHAGKLALHVLRVLGGHHVVGDDERPHAALHEHGHHGLYDGGLAGAHGAADAYTGNLLHERSLLQLIKRRTRERA